MTKRERAQVVELLRCAADPGSEVGIFEAALSLGYSLELADIASDMRVRAFTLMSDPDYEASALEAAAIVEEGSWP